MRAVADLTRRGALRAIAGFGLGMAAGACGSQQGNPDGEGRETPLSCVLTPEQVEGPFFVDTGLLRRDIVEDRPGTPLRLVLRLATISGASCEPVAGAWVEAWHADAEGVYSGYPQSAGNLRDATGETFLRGRQISDDRGFVEFETIYPGWYPGRTPHIHLIVRLDATRRLTTQVYFPEADNDAVLAEAPYAARGVRGTTNATDVVGGRRIAELTCAVSRAAGGVVARYGLGVAA